MAIVETIDSIVANEIRWILDPSITEVELPDDIVMSRMVLEDANDWVLQQTRMTEAEYTALPDTDVRKKKLERCVIRMCASTLTERVAQLTSINVNGLYTRYQIINWKDKKAQIDGKLIDDLSKMGFSTGASEFYEAISVEHK